MKQKPNFLYKAFSTFESMKVGVLPDTHSYIDPLVLQQLTDCKLILHAGDIGSIEVINELKQISQNVVSVCGNNDNVENWQATEIDDLQNIPQIAEIDLPGGSLALTHGDKHYSSATWHENLRESFPKAKAIVYGHSHRLECDQSEDPWVLNPGAAGKTRTWDGVSCLLINTNIEQWEVTTFRT